MKRITRLAQFLLMAVGLCGGFGFLLTGCDTFDDGTQAANVGADPGKPAASDFFSVGDKVTVTVSLSGTPTADQPIPLPHEENIRQDGTITMPMIGPVKAAGKTPGELQQDIYNLYVPRYFTANLNVIVSAPERVFYVGGEVKLPNRYLYTQGITVTKAIKAAGDFTEFANKKNVTLIREDGSKFKVNCEKAIEDSTYDLAVYPGDTITVHRHW